jgi:hypothetical protein
MLDSGEAQAERATPKAPRWPRRESTSPQAGRSVLPPDYDRRPRCAASHAIAWLLPWSANNYPGYRKGVAELLGNRVTWHAIIKWHRKGVWPIWAAQRVRDAVADRVARGQAILRELDADIAADQPQTQRNTGFCVVQEDTGKDRRGHWRR